MRVGTLSPDGLRNWKDLSIVVITLSSRSAIAGGLPPEIAFSMSDAFVRQIEEQKNRDKVMELCRKAEVEFCLAVREQNHSGTKNATVLRCRDLVSRRINAKLTVSELA